MEPLLKIRDVAAKLNCGQTKVYEWLASGELESLKIDGARRVTEEALAAFVAKRQAETRVPA
jgi:excisionase family DNA binding protein